MSISIYIVDAFAERVFTGNPAAVCPLESWLDEELMQKIAAENNLAETAFFVPVEEGYHIRWFTPKLEVDLCGHATLATAHVLFEHLGYAGDSITFRSRSGALGVRRDGDLLVLDFPTDALVPIDPPESLVRAFGMQPVEAFKGNVDYMLIFETQEQIENAKPDFGLIASNDSRGAIISAPGRDVDFVSRYFAPQYGIDEDPATGSAHTTLMPYWYSKTGRHEMRAIQLSERRGYFECVYKGERVEIKGRAFTYSIGTLV